MDTGKMNVETWIREEDSVKDLQEDWNLPQNYSWLKKPYCYGSEYMTDEQQAKYSEFFSHLKKN